MYSILLLSLAFAPAAFAQQIVWGQCGGIGWTGATTCVSGSTCMVQNPYYSQCLPGTVATTATTKATTTAKTSSTKTSSTKATSTTLSTVTSKPTPTTSSTTKSSTTTTKTTTSSQPAATGFEFLISFGDSYSQTGFTSGGTPATAGNILGNPAFPGYTTTNGNNWIDFLISEYNNTLILSYNYAYGGATTDAALITPYEPTVLSLIDQTTEFHSALVPAPSTAPWTSSNALFAVWMGVNDVGNGYYQSDWTTLAESVIAEYMTEVGIMYSSGARNFLFLTVPPIQFTPLVIGEGTSSAAATASGVAYYNSLLTAAISTFKSENPAATVYVFDTTAPFEAVINNPTAYGVGSSNATCFNSDGVSCVWWNNYHPGQAIHNQVAKGIASLLGI